MTDTIETEQSVEKLINTFISSDKFPCVGAKAALATGHIEIRFADQLDKAHSDIEIHKSLLAFGQSISVDEPFVQSLIVVFNGPRYHTETEFESDMWNRLQALHNIDVAAGYGWAEGCSTNPEDAHFSMSFGAQAFFVVGLHPAASRPARRFDRPMLVFNSHAQFEALRDDGRYYDMQRIIRAREKKITGSVNPMLSDHGEQSEALQYSGRKLPSDWTCPFSAKEPYK